MQNKISFIVSIILVVVWMGMIFFLSAMPGTKSNLKSETVISTVIEKTVSTTNGLGITNKHPSVDKMNEVVEFLNRPLRKCAHATVYFILVVFLVNLFKIKNLSNKKAFLISIIICIIYALTDEWHQRFVPGRLGQLLDVLIDTCGGFLGIFFYMLINKIFKIKKREKYS